MNIFVLDNDPVVAASYMDCQRVPKMVVESVQMMACAIIRHGATPDMMPLTSKGTPHRGGYHHHPCSRWAGDNRANYLWLTKHALALCNEYKKRFGKQHACYKAIVQLGLMRNMIPDGSMTPFALAMPDEFKSDDAVESYRDYYQSKDNVHYRHSEQPAWWGLPNLWALA